MQKEKTSVLCPRCKRHEFTPYEDYEVGMPLPPALSRTDNETDVCSNCGTVEALEQWQGILTPQENWPVEG